MISVRNTLYTSDIQLFIYIFDGLLIQQNFRDIRQRIKQRKKQYLKDKFKRKKQYLKDKTKRKKQHLKDKIKRKKSVFER